jgi:transcriptional regulator with XRE-family HTH domain
MFSKILRELRNERKLTQQELADKLDVSRMTINFYESNRRTPDINFAIKAANFFNVSVDYLVGNSNIKSKEDHRYTKEQVENLEDIIYYLPATSAQDLLKHLCDVLKIAHDKKIEREILYLLSMVAYNAKFIAHAEPKELFKMGCQLQKEMAEIVYDTVKQMGHTVKELSN